MKLEINLADREEIAAAVPLLQLILENTAALKGKISTESARQVLDAHAVGEPSPLVPIKEALFTNAEGYRVPLSESGKEYDAMFPPQHPNMPCVTLPPLPPSPPVSAGELADPATVFGSLPHESQAIQNAAQNLIAAGRAASAGIPTVPGAFEGGAAPLAPSTSPAAGAPINVPPPPATPAPTTTTPGPVSSGADAASVELDKAGLPWDSRIHSSSKAKLANGNWKIARGKAPEYVKEIEAQLRGVITTPASPVPSPPSGLPGLVPAPASADPTTFEQLMPRITAAVTAGILPPPALGAACAANGLTSIVSLQTSPHFVPLVWATLQQQYPGVA